MRRTVNQKHPDDVKPERDRTMSGRLKFRNVRVSPATYVKLNRITRRGESQDDVVSRLLAEATGHGGQANDR